MKSRWPFPGRSCASVQVLKTQLLPSCDTRRMVEIAALLADEVLPASPGSVSFLPGRTTQSVIGGWNGGRIALGLVEVDVVLKREG